MAGASEALQRSGDGAGRTDLADQIDRADVDAKFERGGGDDCAQISVLQAHFGRKPQRPRQAAMMRQYKSFANTFGQRMRGSLGKAAAVDEH